MCGNLGENNMNVLVKTVGGGIFSTFTIAIQQILNDIPNVDEIDNIYIELDNDNLIKLKHCNFFLANQL